MLFISPTNAKRFTLYHMEEEEDSSNQKEESFKSLPVKIIAVRNV